MATAFAAPHTLPAYKRCEVSATRDCIEQVACDGAEDAGWPNEHKSHESVCCRSAGTMTMSLRNCLREYTRFLLRTSTAVVMRKRARVSSPRSPKRSAIRSPGGQARTSARALGVEAKRTLVSVLSCSFRMAVEPPASAAATSTQAAQPAAARVSHTAKPCPVWVAGVRAARRWRQRRMMSAVQSVAGHPEARHRTGGNAAPGKAARAHHMRERVGRQHRPGSRPRLVMRGVRGEQK